MYSSETVWGLTSFGLACTIVGLLILFGGWYTFAPIWRNFEFKDMMMGTRHHRKKKKQEDDETAVMMQEEAGAGVEGVPWTGAPRSWKDRRILFCRMEMDYFALLLVAVAYLIISLANRPFMTQEASFNVECSQYDSILYAGHVILLLSSLYHCVSFTLPIVLSKDYRSPKVMDAWLALFRLGGSVLLFSGVAAIALVGRTRDLPVRTCNETGMVESNVSFAFYIALSVVSVMGFGYICSLIWNLWSWEDPRTWLHIFSRREEQDEEGEQEEEEEEHKQEKGKTWKHRESAFRTELINILDHHYGGYYRLNLAVQFFFSVSECIILLHDVILYSVSQGHLVATATPFIAPNGVRIWLDTIMITYLLYHGYLFVDRLWEPNFPTCMDDVCTGDQLLDWMTMQQIPTTAASSTSLSKHGQTDRGDRPPRKNKRERRRGILEWVVCFPFDLLSLILRF